MKYHRHLKNKILRSIKASPVVLLTGGRQTGKTTLMEQLSREEGIKLITLDDLRYLSAMSQDPVGFLEEMGEPLIIDEMQRSPNLALPIKQRVDANRRAGMYVLTGSSNPLVLPKLNDSLAGRMFILNLYPFSQSELRGEENDLLKILFSEELSFGALRGIAKEELIDKMCVGGYPTAQTLDEEMREEWFNNHLRTLLERDVQELAKIRKIEELPHLLQLLAGRSGNLLNISEVSRASKLPNTTLNFYLTLLQALYLIMRLPSWHKNATRRMTKSPKLHITDTGLLSFLIGANRNRLLSHPQLFGSMIETFVVMEIQKLMSFSNMHLQSFHYRSSDGHEVDLILENRAGELVGIEIKGSYTVKSDDFKGLHHLKKAAGNLFFRGLVLYPGDSIIPFGDDLFAVPVTTCL